MAAALVIVPQAAWAAIAPGTPPLKKCAGSYAEAPGFNPAVFDDTSTWIQYTGIWNVVNDTDGGLAPTMHFTDAGEDDTPSDNWATLYFYGNAVTFFYRTEPGAGGIGIYFDDKLDAPAYQFSQSSYDGGRYYKGITYCDNVNGARWHSIRIYTHNTREYYYTTNVDGFQIHQYVY